MGVNGLGRGEFERCLQGVFARRDSPLRGEDVRSTSLQSRGLITHRARQRTPVVVVNNEVSNHPSAFSRRIELKATGTVECGGI